MKPDFYKELQKEREKLDRLVDEALKNGTPICKTQAIMDQSKKIENLILKRNEEDALQWE
ncbi:MAG: hypothetical protein PHO15_11270 [Eubacteriales bacterium]|nr:hypothetical protein [Eubacteriales bacterium]